MENDDVRRNLDRLVAMLTLLLVFLIAARYTIGPDTWWHLRAGAWIWQHKALPMVDPFSFTKAGAPWHYPGGVIEVWMYGLYRLGGLGMLNLWTAGMVTLTFAVVWATAKAHPLLKAAFVLLGALTASPHWMARPFLMTVLLTALFIYLLERWRAGHRWALWALPMLMVLWVNSHGGYILGVVWWGVYFVAAWGRCVLAAERPSCRPAVQLTAVGALLVVAMLLNPYGAEMLRYPFYTLHMKATKALIAEWQSPDFHRPIFLPLLVMLLLLVLGAGWSARRWRLEAGLLAAGMVHMVLNWQRNVDVFAVVTAPILAQTWETVFQHAAWRLPVWKVKEQTRPHPRLNLALVALMALAAFGKAGVFALPSVNATLTARNYPVGAVEYLRQHHPPGHLFNDYNWGGYLTWALPAYPVFVDGRADLYGDDFLEQVVRVMRAQPGWQGVLDYWDVRLVLIRGDAPLAEALPAEGWRLLYADDQSVLYGR